MLEKLNSFKFVVLALLLGLGIGYGLTSMHVSVNKVCREKTEFEKEVAGVDWQVTDSGLKYVILTPGSDKRARDNSLVEVDYEGRLLDGTTFDSSFGRGEPAGFRLNQVIPGWQEGLKLIGPGGEIVLMIPPELAYGDRPKRKIPINSTLFFNVTLHDIKD